jgi:hypothetical protein
MACAMAWSTKAKHHSDWEYELATALLRHVCFLQHTKGMRKYEGASTIEKQMDRPTSGKDDDKKAMEMLRRGLSTVYGG